jgi:prolyl-tRNA synthetase
VVVTLVQPDGSREPLAIGVPGERDVDMKRLEAQVEPSSVETFGEADFAANPTLVKGYIGPGCSAPRRRAGFAICSTHGCRPGRAGSPALTRRDSHVLDLVVGRDFTADGTIEAADVRDGDACPNCGASLETARGIEMGHIFQLGRRFAEALELQVLDELGKLVTVTMGSYGIGISRAVAAIVENSHDELGIVWPREVSPADVHVVATGKDPAIFEAADRLVDDLEEAGLSVLYDDRPKVSPGVKFKDAELIGVPTIAVVGRGVASVISR